MTAVAANWDALPHVAAIRKFLEQRTGTPLQVVGVAPGASHDGWILAPADRPRERIVARLEPAEGPFLHYDGRAEAGLLHELRLLGLPVPSVLAYGGPEVCGTGFLALEWIDGQVYNPRVASQLSVDERHQLAVELAGTLARLHAVPIASLGTFASRRSAAQDDAAGYFAQFDESLAQLRVIDAPVLHYVRVWLQQHAAEMHGEVALVHGDFRLANLVWNGGRISGILDWETARLGNPLFDVGWVCMGALSGSDLVMGLVARDEFVGMYGRSAGRSVGARDVLFWQIAAAWVRGCTELRLLDLAVQRERSGPVDPRDLSWEFGSYRTDDELLRLIDAYEASGCTP